MIRSWQHRGLSMRVMEQRKRVDHKQQLVRRKKHMMVEHKKQRCLRL